MAATTMTSPTARSLCAEVTSAVRPPAVALSCRVFEGGGTGCGTERRDQDPQFWGRPRLSYMCSSKERTFALTHSPGIPGVTPLAMHRPSVALWKHRFVTSLPTEGVPPCRKTDADEGAGMAARAASSGGSTQN
jgi:hypothetical protein